MRLQSAATVSATSFAGTRRRFGRAPSAPAAARRGTRTARAPRAVPLRARRGPEAPRRVRVTFATRFTRFDTVLEARFTETTAPWRVLAAEKPFRDSLNARPRG